MQKDGFCLLVKIQHITDTVLFFVGKLVRLIKQSNVGGWIVGFVYDDDRKAINHAAGWSDMKKRIFVGWRKI